MKRILWTSSMDLSPDAVAAFCREHAGRYGKTESELRALPLLELASCYMWNERNRTFRALREKLSVPVRTPILVIADKADFMHHSHKECSVLSGERLSEILHRQDGVPITFYSDGKDIRAEELTEDGTNFYLYRAVTTLKGLGAFISQVEQGEPFTESQLSALTDSLAPQVHQLMGWPAEHESLAAQIRQAEEKKPHVRTGGKEPAMSQDR